MTDDTRDYAVSDLRRRAAQQASIGNYWAGKCVGLIERLQGFACKRCGCIPYPGEMKCWQCDAEHNTNNVSDG